MALNIRRIKKYSVATAVAISLFASLSVEQGFAAESFLLAQSDTNATESERPAIEKPGIDTQKNEKRAEEPVNADDSADKTDEETSNTPSATAESFDNQSYPQVMRDLEKLPFPVRRMRELILEAARSGDIEKLRPLIGYGDDLTMLSLGGIDEDPIAFLKSLSGDDKGHEILAILTEVLESGYVHMDAGSEQELYVWPYFFAWPLDKLSDAQKVELYRIVTHGDYEDMQSFGAYIFYRVGITPRGRWRFFVAGD